MFTETVLVQVPALKSSYNEDFNAATPTKFVGSLLAFKQAQKFTLAGVTVTVPGETANTDPKLRTFSVLMQLVNVVFQGMEADTEAEPESAQATFCAALNDAGFIVRIFSKAATLEAVRIWLRVKKARIQTQVRDTRIANAAKWKELADLTRAAKPQVTALKAITNGK